MPDPIYADFAGPRPRKNKRVTEKSPKNAPALVTLSDFVQRYQTKGFWFLFLIFSILIVVCLYAIENILYAMLVFVGVGFIIGLTAVLLAIWSEKVSPDSWDQ